MAAPQVLISDENKQIKKIMEDKAANKTGWFFKVGCQVANQQAVMEISRQIVAVEEQVKTKQIEAKLKISMLVWYYPKSYCSFHLKLIITSSITQER